MLYQQCNERMRIAPQGQISRGICPQLQIIKFENYQI
jgi:hypothetical protein